MFYIRSSVLDANTGNRVKKMEQSMIGVWLGIGLSYVLVLIVGFMAGWFANMIETKRKAYNNN